MDLAQTLQQEREAAYIRLRGGFSIPIAGAIYWLALGIAGYFVSIQVWVLAALWGSGAIFPLALLCAKLFNNPFMKDKSAVDSALLPTFISMLLFWPMAIAALWTEPELFPLVLAIGMSIHWPVIGWTYNRTLIYSAHAVIRAVAVFFIWVYLPEARFTLLPLAVAVVYLLTVLVIIIDSGRARAAQNQAM